MFISAMVKYFREVKDRIFHSTRRQPSEIYYICTNEKYYCTVTCKIGILIAYHVIVKNEY